VSSPLFTLLLEEDVLVDPRKFGPIVAPALGLTLVEARMAVRKGRGIFLENLPLEHADRIAGALAAEGIRVRAVPKEGMPALSPCRRVTTFEHAGELLAYRAEETLQALPWEAILVASCGVVAREEYRELFGHVPFGMIPPIHKLDGSEREIVRENLILKMSGPAPDNRLAREKKRQESIFEAIQEKLGSKVRVYADLVTADLGTWLRVPLEEISYLRTPDGVRMGGAWGFQLLVNDLRQACGSALTEMTLKLLESTDIKEHVFPQVEEFTRYTTWVALKRTLWPSAASSSPSPEPPAPPTDAGSSSASPGPEAPSTSS
jgi:hypothetical protein